MVAPREASCAFLSCLTRLTYLDVMVRRVDGLFALSGLTRLRDLAVSVKRNGGGEQRLLDDTACAALSQLVSLTWLHLWGCDTTSPRSLSALAGLPQLVGLSVDGVAPATLGVVAGRHDAAACLLAVARGWRCASHHLVPACHCC